MKLLVILMATLFGRAKTVVLSCFIYRSNHKNTIDIPVIFKRCMALCHRNVLLPNTGVQLPLQYTFLWQKYHKFGENIQSASYLFDIYKLPLVS